LTGALTFRHSPGVGALIATVAYEISTDRVIRGLDIRFGNASSLRFLDELDLARYRTSDGCVRGFMYSKCPPRGGVDEEIDLLGYE